MHGIFFDKQGEIRSGWRASLFFLSVFVISFIMIGISIVIIAQLPMSDSVKNFLPNFVPYTIVSIVSIALGGLYGKLFEHLPFSALGISLSGNYLRNLVFGCLIGAVAFCSALIFAVMCGGLSVKLNDISSTSAITSTLLTTLFIFIVGALSEEAIFRGYLFQTLLRSEKQWVAIGITSFLFATLHVPNPSASPLSWLNTFLAGIWFAAAYMKTRDIWFPLGIHLMWNWLQGPVFGINVSGISEFSPDPVLRAIDSGPAWLTGGAYGIEGGIACTIAIVISIGLVYYLPNLKPSDEEV